MDIEQKILINLVNKGILSKELAEEIKLSALSSGRSISDLLIKKNLVGEDEILANKADIFHTSFINLAGKGISPEILTYISESVARKYKLIPFELDKKNKKLHIAMADPMDLSLIELLEKKTGYSITPYFAKESQIIERIDEEYARGLAFEVSEVLKETSDASQRLYETSQIGQVIKEAPIAKIVSTILEYALRSRASDIHIEPQETRTRVRYRIDGIMGEKLILPKLVHDAVISRIKILSDMKIDERRIPQDGRFNFKLGGDEVDLRVSTLPTVHGEKVVMRLLKKTGGIPDLTELGLRGITLKNLEQAILRPHGIILVTGPTGSGKTTTLYSVLSRLNTSRVNIMTLEDPVEYEIIGLNQVQINPTAGLTFASGLRSFLRQDPNIILVGEIRDNETTSLAIQAALTGHLVFSTLHTNNASTAIPRLLDLGAEPFLIVSVLNVVVAQRIVRKICTFCKESFIPPAPVRDDIKNVLGPLFPQAFLKQKDIKEIALYKGRGCKECNNTGYLGRVGIFEVIVISPTIGRLILSRATAEEIEQQATKEGLITLKNDGYLKVLEGISTIEEILRVAQE
ncbi:type II/IV secretion system protein [Candidatus Gottesmanbacteria bacterium]|nr:type II/IV secretion system protein [Candidatus Gottesmanbacteria bacterium]